MYAAGVVRFVRDDPEHPDAGFAELYASLPDATDLEPAPAYKKLRYDLCSACHLKFLADPLNREAQKFDFSEN